MPVARPTRAAEVPVLALGAFTPPLSLAIKQLKYSARTDLVQPLAELWWQHWGTTVAGTPQPASGTVLVPVPLHAGRLVERGFNQSALLAGALARLARARVGHAVLERVHATGQQARLTARERAHNLRGALRVSAEGALAPDTRIVLIDDVVTTGATLVACQDACRSRGHLISAVWALAHTERIDPQHEAQARV